MDTQNKIQREIKFRAWEIKKKIMWESGFEVNMRETGICSITTLDKDYKYTNILFTGALRGYYLNAGYDKEDCILMQYTGLKDRNGKEIYEHDLIKNKSGRINEVIWVCGEIYCGWSTKMKTDTKKPTNFPQWEDIEVTGNIYENPELLKNKAP